MFVGKHEVWDNDRVVANLQRMEMLLRLRSVMSNYSVWIISVNIDFYYDWNTYTLSETHWFLNYLMFISQITKNLTTNEMCTQTINQYTI